jgi:hypothetical protein
MLNASVRKGSVFLICLFIGLALLFFLLPLVVGETTVDFRVLQIGNALLFALSFISLRMSSGALTHQNVQVFLRLVYGSFIMKFFVIAIGAFIYIAIYKKNVNKPALFGCIGLYFIYTFIEVRSVIIQSKKKNA